MLENIKTILSLTDDRHDQMIMLYISKFATVVVSYCRIDELNPVLESFIEDKVVEVMKPKVGGGSQNTGEVKSVSRGDTKIEYNVGDSIADVSSGAILSEKDKRFLNAFKPNSWRLL